MIPLPEFRNEPYLDFSHPDNRRAMERRCKKVRGELGREYDLFISGERIKTGNLLKSVNPSRPAESIVGVHDTGHGRTSRESGRRGLRLLRGMEHGADPGKRVKWLLRAAALLRGRESRVQCVAFAGGWQDWPEAEAETREAIDFCEYYARQMLRFLPAAEHRCSCPAKRTSSSIFRSGSVVIIPPWNFALAILGGMTVASLVTGNTTIIKPSSDTPTVAQKFAEVLLEAGFPAQSFSLLVGSGAEVGDVLVAASEDAVRFVHGIARRRAAGQ